MAYHHGDLPRALLTAAEDLLRTEGVPAITWRAVARSAGVSHAAPARHFTNLTHLLSDLAAVGFERLTERASEAMKAGTTKQQRLHLLGSTYVAFALDNAELFSLMFRHELLDRSARRLRDASAALLDLLATANGTGQPVPISFDAAAEMALAWAQVHGLAVLAIEQRLSALTERISPAIAQREFIDRLIAG
jgi:AcrR family transcriptional regulator